MDNSLGNNPRAATGAALAPELSLLAEARHKALCGALGAAEKVGEPRNRSLGVSRKVREGLSAATCAPGAPQTDGRTNLRVPARPNWESVPTPLGAPDFCTTIRVIAQATSGPR